MMTRTISSLRFQHGFPTTGTIAFNESMLLDELMIKKNKNVVR
jgi:hypothetical protein